MAGVRERRRPGSAGSTLLRVVYWLAVLAVSLVIVYLLIGWLEALDSSSLDAAAGAWETA